MGGQRVQHMLCMVDLVCLAGLAETNFATFQNSTCAANPEEPVAKVSSRPRLDIAEYPEWGECFTACAHADKYLPICRCFDRCLLPPCKIIIEPQPTTGRLPLSHPGQRTVMTSMNFQISQLRCQQGHKHHLHHAGLSG